MLVPPKPVCLQMIAYSARAGQTLTSASYVCEIWSPHAIFFGADWLPWRFGSRLPNRKVVSPWQQKRQTSEVMQDIIDRTAHRQRKGINSIILLIWQELNNCIFRGEITSSNEIITAVVRSLELWRLAGAKCLQSPFGDPP